MLNSIKDIKEQTKKKSILYVEDDTDTRCNGAELLTNLFGSVSSAIDGLDGLNRYKDGHYDYLITDIKMPKMNGIDMIKAIREINPHQKIVIITAHDESEYLHELAQMNISYILQKPMNFDSLVAMLTNLVL